MPVTTTNENIIVERDYTDNFSIKETALKNLGQKYFDEVELSGLNVGALGFTMEHIANITEDAFNTSSILLKEAFPNKACIPESLYSHAAIFQIDNTFASCASCSFIMVLTEQEILEHAQLNNGKLSTFIDKRTIINVESIPFTLDYDIRIDAQKKQLSGSEAEYDFSAQYVIDYKNSISNVNDPYLKIRKTNNGFLILSFIAHQVERLEMEDTIINNTKINFPVLEFEFDGELAGFDIFYKAPGDIDYTQLTKRIMFSLPIKTPFCYYRLKDTNTLKITFSSRDGYFKPEFNSDIKIIMYLTKGKNGNFDVYNGTNIDVNPENEKYEYNSLITMAVKPLSSSMGGNDTLSLEGMQALTVESYSNATELSTENDIETYFYNYKYRYTNEIKVIKRRDDITERLFSAFLLMKNADYIYPTNTLHLNLLTDDFDTNDKDTRFSLQPGHVFVYEDDSKDTVRMIPDVMCYDIEEVQKLMEEYAFVYTNPFLISVNKTPNSVGMYQTISNQTCELDFISANDTTFTQFIAGKISITRGLNSNKSYVLSLSIAPSLSMDPYARKEEIIDEETGEVIESKITSDVRIFVGFENKYGTEMGYLEFKPVLIDEKDPTTVTFEAILETNDYITSNGLFPIINAVKTQPHSDYAYIPISDVTANIYIFFFDGITETNRLTDYYPDLKYYALTNIYNTKEDPITFIQPMNMMRSTVEFKNMVEDMEHPILNANIQLLPMIKATIPSELDNFNTFIEILTNNYNYITQCLPLLRNNTHIDIKFYNTYGKSINYYIGDNEQLIDRVDIKVKFKITLVDGGDEAEVNEKLKIFIKNFIERINSDGSNNLYISNLIREIETNFASVHHLKFMGINDYSTDQQTITLRETNLDNLTKSERRKYVPEMLVVDRTNILLSITEL